MLRNFRLLLSLINWLKGIFKGIPSSDSIMISPADIIKHHFFFRSNSHSEIVLLNVMTLSPAVKEGVIRTSPYSVFVMNNFFV